MYRQFNIQQFYVLPTQLCGSQNKQPLFPYTTLTDWFFVTEMECVYCAVRSSYFLGAFAKLRNATISVLTFVRLTAWNNSTPNGRIFIKFDI